MSTGSKVQPLRIADAARGIRHVFIRNLEVLAQIGIYGHEQGKLQPVRINVDLAVEDVIAVEDKLEKVVPNEFKLDAHHWLILHGRYVCKARKPDCPQCVIRDLCEYKHKTAAA